jgi:hypothetical protein
VRISSQSGIDLDARFEARVDKADGSSFRMTGAFSRVESVCSGAYFKCEGGTFRMSLGSDGTVDLLDGGGRPLTELRAREGGADAVYHAFRLEWESFVALCRGVGGEGCDARGALLTTSLIEQVYAKPAGVEAS